MPANRKNPGVHHAARQSRDREGALADYVAGMRSLTVAARIGASRPSTFMSRTSGKTEERLRRAPLLRQVSDMFGGGLVAL